MRSLHARRFFLLAVLVLVLNQSCSIEHTSESSKAAPSKPLNAQSSLNKVEQAVKQADLSKVIDSFTICSINDVPLTMSDYRHQLRAQQQQVQTTLSVNPQAKLELIELAKQRGITLTAEEQKQILTRAKALQSASQKSFNKFLKANKVTEADFNTQVLQVGLACKTSKSLIEDSLIKELTSRELLCQAAKENGLSKQALNNIIEMKNSPQYKQLVNTSGLTGDQIEKELLKNELCKLMIAKLESTAPVTEAEVKEYYETNKGELKHGRRIRLSQILIAAPMQDQGSVLSIKTQIHKSNPKLSEADLEKETAAVLAQQKQKAAILLGKALTGVNFAQLANENSQDMAVHQSKNGGDMGLQEETHIVKPVLDKVQSLKDGQVVPILIQSQLGFHIVKVTGKEKPGVLSFAECRDQIKQLLTQQKGQEAVDKYLNDRLATAKITLSPELQALLSQLNPKEKTNNVAQQ